MRVLVIGGTGLIGSHTAHWLAERGNEVVVGGRRPPTPDSLVADMAFEAGDYAAGDFDRSRLESYDAVVMTAGNDVRHVAPDQAGPDFWASHQSEGVPALAAVARAAGVARFVQVGSCYHVVLPRLVDTDPYVRARRDADEHTRSLTTPEFTAITINPPPVVGVAPGPSARRWAGLVQWARGQHPDQIPLVAPPGGTNYLSVRSMAEAVGGALDRGEPGAAYLVGDENLTYAQYFQLLVDLAGGTGRVRVLDKEHPLLPDRMMVSGRGAVFAFEPDPASVELLAYGRTDVARALSEIVSDVECASLA